MSLQQGQAHSSPTLALNTASDLTLSSTTQKKQRKKYVKRNIVPIQGKNYGHWTSNQKYIYYTFLEEHQHHFMKSQMRRTDKIFKEMARVLGTRQPDQCRSHHQKMEKKYGNFNQILQSMRKCYGQRNQYDLYKTCQEATTNGSPQQQDSEVGVQFNKLSFDFQNFPQFMQDVKTTTKNEPEEKGREMQICDYFNNTLMDMNSDNSNLMDVGIYLNC